MSRHQKKKNINSVFALRAHWLFMNEKQPSTVPFCWGSHSSYRALGLQGWGLTSVWALNSSHTGERPRTHVHTLLPQTAAWTLQECTTHLHVHFALNNWNMDFTVSLENLQPEKSGVFISITSLWVLKGNLKGCKGLEIVGVRQVKKRNDSSCPHCSSALVLQESISCQVLKSHPQKIQYCYYWDYTPTLIS